PLGGAERVIGAQLLQPSDVLVPVQGLAMEFGGLPVNLAQGRVGAVGHQLLAALGGGLLVGLLLSRPVGELLRTPSPLMVLLGISGGHDSTLLPQSPRAKAWTRLK